MKRFNVFLFVAMIIGGMIFTSCTSSGFASNNDTAYNETKYVETNTNMNSTTNNSNGAIGDETQDTSKNVNTSDSIGNSSTEQSNKVNLALQFTAVNDYSNGLLFATPSQSYKLYCINKQGDIQYMLEGTKEKNYHDVYPYNGEYAFLLEYSYDNNGRYKTPVLCDCTGKMVYPNNVGADYFYAISNYYEDSNNFGTMFAQGYVFAIKQTTDFSGTKTELAVLNKKLEKIIDFSESSYSLFYGEFGACKGSYYGDGYFQVSGKYYDLNTLNEYTEEEVLNLIVKNNASDFWKWDKDGTAYKAHDIRTGDIKVDLSEYNTIAHITDFQNGTAGVLFKTDVIYFSIVDETGKLLFEPVKTNIVNTPGFGLYYVSYENGIYVVYGNNANNQYNCYSFDANGLISTKSLDIAITSYARISDGVIVIRDSSVISLFNTKLEPLF